MHWPKRLHTDSRMSMTRAVGGGKEMGIVNKKQTWMGSSHVCWWPANNGERVGWSGVGRCPAPWIYSWLNLDSSFWPSMAMPRSQCPSWKESKGLVSCITHRERRTAPCQRQVPRHNGPSVSALPMSLPCPCLCLVHISIYNSDCPEKKELDAKIWIK